MTGGRPEAMLHPLPSPRTGARTASLPSLRAGEDGVASTRCISWSEVPPEPVERPVVIDPVGELYRSADHHVWELVENEMVTQEESGNSHPVIMLTKTLAGTLARLHTVGERYFGFCPERVPPGRGVQSAVLTCSHAENRQSGPAHTHDHGRERASGSWSRNALAPGITLWRLRHGAHPGRSRSLCLSDL